MIDKQLLDWEHDIKSAYFETGTRLVILLSENGKMLYANKAFKNTFPYFSIQKLLNPSFEKIKSLRFIEGHLIFNDFITIGNYSSSSNLSFTAYIYKNQNQFLIVGQKEPNQLLEQNQKLNELVQENSNLQRQLLRKTKNLENTLTELDKINSALKKQIQTKDKIFSIITHDLRSPFAGILGISELLKENLKDLESDEIETYINHIYKASVSYNDLTENLLNWASLQLNKYAFHPKKSNIFNLVSEVYSVLKENAKMKGITIKINLKEDIVFRVDQNMFSGIVRNLVSNAIKFTPEKGEINMHGSVGENQLFFSIQDNGIGLSEEKINSILNNELIQSTRGTANEKGVGLGISMCKEFIEIHQGELKIESEIYKGTRFTFSIPDINNN